MQIELVEDPGLIARIGESATSKTRSAGLHVSEIYGRLMARLEPKKYGKPIDAEARLRMEVGILFENMLEQGLREKYATTRVGEVVSPEGIILSPDGVNPTLCRGEEYKATFKSCRDGLVDDDGAPYLKFLAWFIQMKAYAKWLYLSDWILRVFFIAGDYNRPLLPQFRTYYISFSDEEIDDNWEMLLRIAREEGLLV